MILNDPPLCVFFRVGEVGCGGGLSVLWPG